MDSVHIPAPDGRQDLQRIGLPEWERVVRLRFDVHTNHIEPCTPVANGCAASFAEQV